MPIPYWEVSPGLHRAIDLAVAPITYLVVLPLTAVYHGVRYWIRPPRQAHMTWLRYVVTNLMRVRGACTRLNIVNYKDPLADQFLAHRLNSECDIVRLTVPPITSDVPRVSVLKEAPEVVQPVDVTAFMIRPKGNWDADILAPAKPGERVIFFIVGGGYANGHPLLGHMSRSLSLLSGGRVFAVNYRKSLTDDSAFPASLYDMLAGYQYLMSLGFEPKNIMLNGDSAGANGCMAVARYLDDLDQAGWNRWGQVGSMCLHCPWSDMTWSFPSLKTNCYTDHLINLNLCYIPSHTRHYPDRSNPYFSPALTTIEDGHFARLAKAGVKVYIVGGGAEAFHDEIIALADGMRDAGVDVTLRVIPGMPHSEFCGWNVPGQPPWAGWSWPVAKSDFELFWIATAN